MRHIAACCSLLLSLCFAVSTFAEPWKAFTRTDEGQLFTMAGSNTVGAKLAPEWAQAYLEAKGAKGIFIEQGSEPNEYQIKGRNGTRMVFIDIRAHGSSTGFRSLSAGNADIAMASRPIKSAEWQSLQKLGDLRSSQGEHVTAIDGLAVIVHPGNPVAQLSVEQIAKVFAGKLNNWQQLGGPNLPINLYARDDNSGTFDTFKSLVLRKNYSLAKKAARFESNDELSARVSADRGAIGFVGLASVNKAKALAVNDDNTQALSPEVLFVATEDYPLSRRLFLYSAEKPANSFVTEFVNFAQSQQGQQIVNNVGFVSQNPFSLALEDVEGPVAYQQLSKIAERLTINFRFQPGRADLDNKALRDVERLARFVRAANEQGRHIQLVGFSNVESSDKRAQVLSRLRATAVKSALYREGITTESVIGFGDRVPVANAAGQQSVKNDRVEVWLVDTPKLTALNDIKTQLGNEQSGRAGSIASDYSLR